MRFEVVFHYQAGVLRPRKRNPEHVYYRAATTVDVPVVAPADAPVAVRYPDPRMREDGLKPTTELRWHGGSLWRPHDSDTRTRGVGPQRSVEFLRAAFADPFDQRSVAKYRRERYDGDAGFADDDKSARVVKCDREEMEAEIARSVADLIVVDGMAWIRTEEPVLVLHFLDGWGAGSTGVWVGVEEEDAAKRALGNINRMCDVAEARESYERIQRNALEKGCADQYDFSPFPDVEVLIGEAFRYPVVENKVLEAGRDLLKEMCHLVGSGDRAFFDGFATLRDFVEANPLPEGRFARMPEGFDMEGYVAAVGVAIGASVAAGRNDIAKKCLGVLAKYDESACGRDAQALAGI
jgi:hypothetical protein